MGTSCLRPSCVLTQGVLTTDCESGGLAHSSPPWRAPAIEVDKSHRSDIIVYENRALTRARRHLELSCP